MHPLRGGCGAGRVWRTGCWWIGPAALMAASAGVGAKAAPTPHPLWCPHNFAARSERTPAARARRAFGQAPHAPSLSGPVLPADRMVEDRHRYQHLEYCRQPHEVWPAPSGAAVARGHGAVGSVATHRRRNPDISRRQEGQPAVRHDDDQGNARYGRGRGAPRLQVHVFWLVRLRPPRIRPRSAKWRWPTRSAMTP